MNLDLFPETISEEPTQDVEGYVCRDCLEFKPKEQFIHMEAGEVKRTCSDCRNHKAKVVYWLYKSHPYPDDNYACPICERTLEEIGKFGQKKLQSWVLDHCHQTDKFRGWVCFNCNSGLGQFRDNLKSVENAVEYLRRFHEKEG